MKTVIFIRTYKGDIEWLKYCLRSIHKFGSGFESIVICIPHAQRHYLDALNLTQERIVTCPDYERDYLGQQVSKLYAWLHTEAETDHILIDNILYVDSDCVFNRPFSPESFMQDGKPVVFKTHYSKVGDAICWQSVTENFLGWHPDYEYMRRLPIMHKRKIVAELCRVQHEAAIALGFGSFEERIFAQPGSAFSEFNLMGAFADINFHDEYTVIDTDSLEAMEPACVNQYWSRGGLQPLMREEIERILA